MARNKAKRGILRRLFLFGIATSFLLAGTGLVWISTFKVPDLQTFEERKVRQSTKIYDRTGEISVAKASLRYVINSELNVDSTLGGMYNPYHVYENVDAYFHPEMSGEERRLLKKIRKTAKIVAKNLLPAHYRFLEKWVPDSWDDSDLFGTA